MDDKYQDLVDEVARHIYEKTLDTLSPSQVNSEFLADITQDVWAELYTIKSKKPNMPDTILEKHLQSSFQINSLPDPQIIYTDNVETFLSKT
jgi:hypothetical protein